MITHNEHLTEQNMLQIFATCDAVVEALDSAPLKKTLVETLLPTGALVVTASGMGGWSDTDAMQTRRVGKKLYMIGDMSTECCGQTPPMAPKVTLAAAKQADAVLSYYMEQFEARGK